MTDVRLTALNPVDSQVYPVACNTSGELIVEQVDPGPDLTVTGTLTVNGSSTFDSYILVGSTSPSASAPGGFIYSTRYIDATNVGSAALNGQSADGDLASLLVVDRSSGAGVQTVVVKPNGRATFGSRVDAGTEAQPVAGNIALKAINSDSGTSPAIYGSNFGGGRLLDLRAGNAARVLIENDGTAEFTGDITCTDSSKGFVLRSPNGTNYRLSVANDGTLSTSVV